MGEPAFDRFIAIDWTGAKGRRHKAIEVAVCEAGTTAPVRIAPPDKYWSREAVLDFVKAEASTRTLIGFDFSFSLPFLDKNHYLPGLNIYDAPDVWGYVDAHAGDEDLGASSVVETLLRRHFYFGKASGERAAFARLRQCEEQAGLLGLGTPSSAYVCIGASQVAKASFSGMRLLHRAQTSGLKVWPFDPLPQQGAVLVEIYPRAFLRMAGHRNTKLRTGQDLDVALAALGSAPAGLDGTLPDHLTDALIACAGLRHIAGNPHYWRPASLTPAIARTEGWIFGVA